MKKPFSPDKANYRRSFEEERENVLRAVHSSGVDLGLNFSPDQRFYHSWRDNPVDDASRILGNIGSDEFMRLFSGSLRQAKQWIQALIRDYLREYVTVLDPIDEVASGGTLDLARWSRGELGILQSNSGLLDDLETVCSIADSWSDDEDLIVEESLRELTLASKICRLEAVDPWDHVARDMTRINELCSERLWVGRKIVLTLNYAVYEDGEKRGYVHPGVPVTFGKHCAPMVPGASPRSIRAKCRVVVDGDTLFLVLTKSRPKDLETTVLKELERNPKSLSDERRVARDRRGIMNVVVAIRRAGKWRVATPEDNEVFAELAHARLWRSPLHPEPFTPWLNPESSPDYSRVKLLGRFHRRGYRSPGARLEALSVEHQVICITTLLSAQEAGTTLNHDIYRRDRVLRVLIPVLFKGNFERLGLPFNP